MKAEWETKGYTVDTTCYPWVAYKGNRFSPTELRRIPTDKEEMSEKMLLMMAVMITNIGIDKPFWTHGVIDQLGYVLGKLKEKNDEDTGDSMVH